MLLCIAAFASPLCFRNLLLVPVLEIHLRVSVVFAKIRHRKTSPLCRAILGKATQELHRRGDLPKKHPSQRAPALKSCSAEASLRGYIYCDSETNAWDKMENKSL